MQTLSPVRGRHSRRDGHAPFLPWLMAALALWLLVMARPAGMPSYMDAAPAEDSVSLFVDAVPDAEEDDNTASSTAEVEEDLDAPAFFRHHVAGNRHLAVAHGGVSLSRYPSVLLRPPELV